MADRSAAPWPGEESPITQRPRIRVLKPRIPEISMVALAVAILLCGIAVRLADSDPIETLPEISDIPCVSGGSDGIGSIRTC